jgi:hypothetical protein
MNLTAEVVEETLSLMLLHTILLVLTPLYGATTLHLAPLKPWRRREDIMVKFSLVKDHERGERSRGALIGIFVERCLNL